MLQDNTMCTVSKHLAQSAFGGVSLCPSSAPFKSDIKLCFSFTISCINYFSLKAFSKLFCKGFISGLVLSRFKVLNASSSCCFLWKVIYACHSCVPFLDDRSYFAKVLHPQFLLLIVFSFNGWKSRSVQLFYTINDCKFSTDLCLFWPFFLHQHKSTVYVDNRKHLQRMERFYQCSWNVLAATLQLIATYVKSTKILGEFGLGKNQSSYQLQMNLCGQGMNLIGAVKEF